MDYFLSRFFIFWSLEDVLSSMRELLILTVGKAPDEIHQSQVMHIESIVVKMFHLLAGC